MRSRIPVAGPQPPDRFKLSELREFVLALAFNCEMLDREQNEYPIAMIGDLYCPACADDRRMSITTIFCPHQNSSSATSLRMLPGVVQGGSDGDELEGIHDGAAQSCVPSLFSLACVQCNTEFTALIYRGPDGPSLAVLPSCHGGLTTRHTPAGVAFYLDQAQRARSVGANSAAVAMFRGALEHLLYDKGYKDGMCGQKLRDLQKHIDCGKTPIWAKELETEYLKVLNDLGNGSIHPNDGDVTKQAALDSDLLSLVQETFLRLLRQVYDDPHEKSERLAALKAKSALLKK